VRTSDHDEIKALFYDGPDDGVQEMEALLSWDRRTFVYDL
jgi:hypothetical protein